jgi:hypothetical protein
MADPYTGKVAWSCEEERLYAIPDDVEDKNVSPDECRSVLWVDEAPDDPDDGAGHWELVPEAEDTYPA